jgi:hypothetical protein
MANIPHQLPFGTLDLDPEVHVIPGDPLQVRCYVKGCSQLLRPPRRGFAGDICPDHGIRCHYSSDNGATYSYADVRRNFIIDADFVATRVVGHPDKFESKRLGLEKSEDALTWNVFRSLQKAHCLHEMATWITVQEVKEEPHLYLWGLKVSDDSLQFWDLLHRARQRFESNLPVDRPLTEPDIALYLPGRFIILIEAKFSSSNPYYLDGPRQDNQSLTKEELIEIYQDPTLEILDVDRARRAIRVHYQLWRNMVFCEWMAKKDGDIQPFLCNLTRQGEEDQSCEEFRQLVKKGFKDQCVHVTWEEIYHRWGRTSFTPLGRYLETKTASLRPALELPMKNPG